jgi:hypothetical protein
MHDLLSLNYIQLATPIRTALLEAIGSNQINSTMEIYGQ